VKACRKYIELMYTHPKVTELLSKIKPVELQNDLRQELAMVLLNYNCKKIIKINKEGNLLGFTLRILWKMGTGSQNEFFKKYKKNNIIENINYFNSIYGNDYTIDEDLSNYAINKLNHKLTINANEAHESIIFKKYVELKSCTKVAEYFSVPKKHIFLVVKKTKDELKKAINDNL
jgi:hypothetical protein